jgi:hypothetical protein
MGGNFSLLEGRAEVDILFAFLSVDEEDGVHGCRQVR